MCGEPTVDDEGTERPACPRVPGKAGLNASNLAWPMLEPGADSVKPMMRCLVNWLMGHRDEDADKSKRPSRPSLAHVFTGPRPSPTSRQGIVATAPSRPSPILVSAGPMPAPPGHQVAITAALSGPWQAKHPLYPLTDLSGTLKSHCKSCHTDTD